MPSATEPAWLSYDLGLAIRLIGLVQWDLMRHTRGTAGGAGRSEILTAPS